MQLGPVATIARLAAVVQRGLRSDPAGYALILCAHDKQVKLAAIFYFWSNHHVDVTVQAR